MIGKNIKLANYNNILFDFDGVILDSNKVKLNCIKEASEICHDIYKRNDFIQYFIDNNGIPREKKINRYFDNSLAKKILNKYNSLLSIQYYQSHLTVGALKIVKKLHTTTNIYIFSGGRKLEIVNYLTSKNIIDLFTEIYAGPLTKYENFKKSKIKGRSLYIGDSKADFFFQKNLI